MKIIYTFILITFSNLVCGQDTLPNMNEDIVINKDFIAKPGEWYIDNVKVDIERTFIHNKNIEKIKRYKGKSSEIYSGAKGATLITRKKHYKFISLDKYIANIISKNEKLEKETDIEIKVNGNLIENTTNYKIELNPDMKISIQIYSDDGVYHGGNKNKPKSQILIETNK